MDAIQTEGIQHASYTVDGPDDVPLAVETYGNPRADRKLLLLHDAFQSKICWRYQRYAAGEDCYIVLPDLPFHGKSGPLASNAAPTGRFWAEVLCRVADAAGLDRFILVPWYFGGIVAGDYLFSAASNGGRVAGLLLVNAVLGWNQGIMRLLFSEYPWMQGLVSDNRAQRMQAAITFTERLFAGEVAYGDYAMSLGDTLLNTMRGGGPNFFLGHVTTPSPEAIFARLESLPVSFVYGTRGTFFAREQLTGLLELAPHARVIDLDCGHTPHIERWQEFNAILLEEASRLSAASRG